MDDWIHLKYNFPQHEAEDNTWQTAVSTFSYSTGCNWWMSREAVPGQHRPVHCTFQPRLGAVVKADYDKMVLVRETTKQSEPIEIREFLIEKNNIIKI